MKKKISIYTNIDSLKLVLRIRRSMHGGNGIDSVAIQCNKTCPRISGRQYAMYPFKRKAS